MLEIYIYDIVLLDTHMDVKIVILRFPMNF